MYPSAPITNSSSSSVVNSSKKTSTKGPFNFRKLSFIPKDKKSLVECSLKFKKVLVVSLLIISIAGSLLTPFVIPLGIIKSHLVMYIGISQGCVFIPFCIWSLSTKTTPTKALPKKQKPHQQAKNLPAQKKIEASTKTESPRDVAQVQEETEVKSEEAEESKESDNSLREQTNYRLSIPVMPTEPLFVAASAGNVSEIEALTKAGTDVNSQELETQMTALHWAVVADKYLALKKLIELGANVNIKDSQGCLPLHWAVYSDNSLVISQLLTAKSHINEANHEGLTPLHLAAYAQNDLAYKILLQNGADQERKNDLCKMTPKHIWEKLHPKS